jgi:hypothetical protein
MVASVDGRDTLRSVPNTPGLRRGEKASLSKAPVPPSGVPIHRATYKIGVSSFPNA